ncbi:hypothetical protein HYT51_00240 [Candidatus Woesearchaeota archaeon]|nr:hypothetical protein [Candidatus Woesearchaeota archaeon]
MTHYIEKQEADIVRKVLQENNYLTQTEVARYLSKKRGYHNSGRSAISIRSFLGQALNGRRPMPTKLVEDLIKLCKNDERLLFLRKPTFRKRYAPRSSSKEESHWEELLHEYYRRLEEKYLSSDAKLKLRILGELEKIVGQETEE